MGWVNDDIDDDISLDDPHIDCPHDSTPYDPASADPWVPAIVRTRFRVATRSGANEYNITLLPNSLGRYTGASVNGSVAFGFEFRFGGQRSLPPGVEAPSSDTDFSYHEDIDAACVQAVHQYEWYAQPDTDFSQLLGGP